MVMHFMKVDIVDLLKQVGLEKRQQDKKRESGIPLETAGTQACHVAGQREDIQDL